MRYVFMDNQFIPEEDATVSVYDSSIVTGDRTTEVVRTFRGVLFELDKHMERLFLGMSEMDLEVSYTKDQLKDKTLQLLEMNQKNDATHLEWEIIYIVTRGMETMYHLFDLEECKVNVIILCFPLANRLQANVEKYHHGAKLLVSSQKAIPINLIAPQIKSRGQVHFKIAKIDVHKRDRSAGAVLLDEDGNFAESTGANLFFVREGKLYTPSGEHILSGITRNMVIDLARQAGLEVIESKIPFSELNTFEECFLTSSIICIQYVRQIEEHIFNKGYMGKITKRLIDLFSAKVGIDFMDPK